MARRSIQQLFPEFLGAVLGYDRVTGWDTRTNLCSATVVNRTKITTTLWVPQWVDIFAQPCEKDDSGR